MSFDTKYEKTSDDILKDPRLDILRDGSGKLALTKTQARAVLERGRLLVSAAAGSGKTSTLVKRILITIAEGTATLKDMLVCVYNDSAQAELKQRLSASFIDAAMRETDGVRRQRLLKAVDDLPFCRISTIHAFCSSLIRENFEKLGISPTFDIADDAEMNELSVAAAESVIDEFAGRGDDELFTLIDIFSENRNENGLVNTILQLCERMILQEDRVDFKRRICADFDQSPLHDELADLFRRRMRGALEILRPVRDSVKMSEAVCKKLIDVPMDQAVEFAEGIERAESFMAMCEFAAGAPPFATHKNRSKNDGMSGEEIDLFYLAKRCVNDMKDVKATLQDVYEKWDGFRRYHAQNVAYVKKLVELAERTLETLDALKSEKNVLGYNDLLLLAKRLLAENDDIGEEYKMIFVDEYQDVDPLQEAIFARLIKDECFMVGDVKQSIYGFRLADPTILLSRRAAYEAGEGKAIDFTSNFRSNRDILNFVNEVFDAVMTLDSADVDYKNDGAFSVPKADEMRKEKSSGVAEDSEITQKHVRLCFVPYISPEKSEDGEKPSAPKGLYDITSAESDDGGESELSKADRLATFILNEINSLVGHAMREDSDDGRKLSYGDIAILSRYNAASSSKLRHVLKVLREAGIPLDETNVGGEASDVEKELIVMLRVIDNPRQDIPLAGYLLSYFGGYTEQELADIASNDGECFYDKLLAQSGKKGELAKKLRATLATLDEYRLKASFKNVRELLQGIISDSMYDAYVKSLGEGKIAELKNFVASVDEVSIGRFLEGYSSSEAKAVGAGTDSVKVSTIHKYKGLESPVVFVLDVAGSIREESKDPIIARDGAIGLKYYDSEKKTAHETFSRFALKKLMQAEQVKDEMRLLYVAFTRAKQLLYVTACVSKDYVEKDFGKEPCISGITNTLDMLSVARLKQSLFRQPEVIPVPVRDLSSAHAPVMNFTADEELKAKLLRARQERYANAEATRLAMKYTVSQIGALEDGSERLFAEGDKDAAKIGTAYHKVMQFIDLTVNSEEEVVGELDAMCKEGKLTGEERAYIDAGRILACLKSPVMRRAAGAYLKGEVEREKPFTMLKPARELGIGEGEDEVLVQGVIDLYIKDEARAIVDFKTGYVTDEKVPDHYKKQLYLYKMAVEAATKSKVEDVYIYSFASGKTVKLDFANAPL